MRTQDRIPAGSSTSGESPSQKQGADLQSADAFISVLFEFKDNCFYLTVSNKISEKKALKKERSGIGAATLEQRLKIIYKNRRSCSTFIRNSSINGRAFYYL